MRHASKNTISLSIAGAAVLVALGGFWFLFHTISSQGAVISGKLQSISDQTSADKKLKMNRTLVAQTEADRTELLTHIVSSDRIIAFIETIEKLGPKTGSVVTISSINSEDDSAQPEGTVSNVTASVQVKGSWTSIMKLIGLFENLPYEVSFDRVRIHAVGDNKRHWEMTFDMKTHKIK